MSIKVNWLIAHKPVNLFIRTAKAFKGNQKCNKRKIRNCNSKKKAKNILS